MKDVLFVFVVVFVALLFAPACGGTADPGPVDDAGPDCAPTHLMVLPGCEVDQ